jgi:putative hemolysin
MSVTEIIVYAAVLVLCLLLSGFFASSETAFIALEKYRIAHLVNNKVKGASRVARLMERPERFLSTVLFGNNLVNTAATALGTVLAISLWGRQWGTIIATVVLTVVILIFAETTPKTIATRHSERLALTLSRPIEITSRIFSPFVFVLSWVASGLSKLVGGDPVPRSLASKEEIQAMILVGQTKGTVADSEAEMLNNVFDFGKRQIGELTIPRTDVISVEQGTTLADFLKIYSEHPLSRYPVYQENMDNVIGIISIKDVLMALSKGTASRDSRVDEIIRPAYFTPETKPIGELFAEMRDKNYHMAIVVDEFGGTSGVVSLSQLVEEIVGPVGDELASPEKDYEVISENTFQIEGNMRVEDANEEMNLDLPHGKYETVAGFVLHHLGHIPKINEGLRYKNLRLVITQMKGRKIEQIKLTKEIPKETNAETKTKV